MAHSGLFSAVGAKSNQCIDIIIIQSRAGELSCFVVDDSL